MNEIHRYNYWEHVKAEKDMAFVLPPTDERRLRIHEAATKMLNKEQEDKRGVTTKMPNEPDDH
jgi:hypothetical protein